MASKASGKDSGRATSPAPPTVATAAEGFCVADETGLIVYADPPALALLGYAEGELDGRDCAATLCHGEPAGGSALAAALRTGADCATDDCDFARADGTALAVAYSCRQMALPDGKRTLVVFRDTSPERMAASFREEADLQASQSETLRRTLTANLPDTSVFLIDRDMRILLADGAAIRQVPWYDEDRFRGQTLTDLDADIPADVLKLSIDCYQAAVNGTKGGFHFVNEGLTFAVQAVPVAAADGTVESALVVVRDVTDRMHAEEQIGRRVRQQAAVAELGRFALQTQDLGELLTEATRVAAATLDIDIADVVEVNADGVSMSAVAAIGLPRSFIGKRLPMSDSANAGETLRTGLPTVVEDMATETRFVPSKMLIREGVQSSLSVPIVGDGAPFGVLNVHSRRLRSFSDDEVEFVTAMATLIIVAVERHGEEQATRHAALHDPLTGLPNRTLALDRLAQALARRRRERIDVAVFVLDVDRFKMINDSLGHAAGDEVLLALTPRLLEAVRPTDTVARLGGDEFCVICPDVESGRGATEIALRLGDAISRPLVLSSGEHFFTGSTGVTLAASKNDTPESLMGDADAAMYRAKERGRGRYELFDEAMRTGVMSRVRVETELRRALDKHELVVWYQPVVDLATGLPVSTEALVRWQHPERGLIGPLEFISIAEDSGLIVALGLNVLEQACRQTAIWQRSNPALGVSVNVSGRQMINPLFPTHVAAIAGASGIEPGSLTLEITESVVMEEADLPATVLDELQKNGLCLALDDFGTGYSSLSRLKRFPLDLLKIDRSFVAGVDSAGDDRAIVKATIDMAHAVGLTVVAEGVETREQEAELKALGCDRGQGYLYARPQPAEALTGFFAAGRAESM